MWSRRKEGVEDRLVDGGGIDDGVCDKSDGLRVGVQREVVVLVRLPARGARVAPDISSIPAMLSKFDVLGMKDAWGPEGKKTNSRCDR